MREAVAEPLVFLDAAARSAQLAADIRAGLAATPKTVPSKYFYDAHGSELFTRITRLPEYYLTRAETALLRARSAEIAALTRAEALVELGSGTSEKTRILLTALRRAGTLQRFTPFDVDAAVLEDASAAVAATFPGLDVTPVVGDFERHLTRLPGQRRRLLAFLGSTIGNLAPEQRRQFLATVRATCHDGDFVLLGVDLVKSPERLLAAYNDTAGITAAFNKNMLAVLNGELDADFDPATFEHVALWDAEREWIEMWLRSMRNQVVHLARLDLEVRFAAGEQMRTEISAKFHRVGVAAELSAAALRLERWWADPAGDFGLALAVPT